ncbi:MAG TPA: MBL fold metallo-hydrolase [Solirubrobacterales bacterium]|nr:MBL fold metallo-hydrolase [Solirubrobacterales bacterium]
MPTTHRIESKVAGVPVNAYVIEGEGQIVAVDATLTVSGGRELRGRIEAIGKPLAAFVLTHAHPDHYGGAVEASAGADAPIVATAGVDAAIRRDDEAKEKILRPMLGDEWPRERVFPTTIVDPGAELTFGDIELRVRDLGPGESPHDSIWFLGEGAKTAFSGDLAYNRMHAYLADGHWEEWLASIDAMAAELPSDAVLHPGHGAPGGLDLLDRQRAYVERFVDAVQAADWSDPERAKRVVVDAMSRQLEREDLRILMELSIDPVAKRLGVSAGAR